MNTSEFPVLYGFGRKVNLGDLLSVPWSLLAPHERQAMRNHGQSLHRLASRGGLSPCEMLAIIDGTPWRDIGTNEDEAVGRLRQMIKDLPR